MVKIYYNNFDVFSGLSPTPLVGSAENMLSYGNRWGQVTPMFLAGTLTGACDDFSDLIAKQEELLFRFREDFHNISIEEDGNVIYDKPYAIIRSISFDESPYVRMVPYRIDIDVYDDHYFSGTFGVLDPSDEISFEENADGFITVDRSISARGFNTNKLAIENAKNWVLSRTGWSNRVVPQFIAICNGDFLDEPCVQNLSENINRFDGTYSVNLNYKIDKFDTNGTGLLRYTTDISTNLDGATEVSLRGSIEGCPNSNFSGLRTRYNSLNFYQLAAAMYSKVESGITLNNIPTSSGVVEDQDNRRIEFNLTFDNDQSPLVVLDYTVSLDTDNSKDLTSASIAATIKSRGPLYSRWDRVVDYFENDFHPYSLVLAEYNLFVGDFNLNSVPASESTTKNEFQAEISYNATWTDGKPTPNPFKTLSYTINVSPSIARFAKQNSLNENALWYVWNLGFNRREEISIQGRGIIEAGKSSSSARATIRSILSQTINRFDIEGYGADDAILDSASVTVNESTREVSFSCTWSHTATALSLV